jgi:hypothetical protein
MSFDTANPSQVIADAFSTLGCCGGTPIAKTFGVSKSYLDTAPNPNSLARYAILATDGAPNCNSDTDILPCDGNECTDANENCIDPEQCLDDVETCSAAADLYGNGYPVYVVGYQVPSKWQTVMKDIAVAGGTTDYFPVDTTQQFVDALKDIVYSLVECDFTVDWTSLDADVDPDPSKVNVHCLADAADEANDQNKLPYNQSCASGDAGYTWLNKDKFELCPSDCQRLKEGQCEEITATFPCEIPQ